MHLAPPVSCISYIIADNKKGKVLASKGLETILQPASLTKILVLYCVLNHFKNNESLMRNTLVMVSKNAADTKQGTHAALLTNDVLSVYDLLYAMMLPSGNDAAVALAEFIGCRLINNKKVDRKSIVVLNMPQTLIRDSNRNSLLFQATRSSNNSYRSSDSNNNNSRRNSLLLPSLPSSPTHSSHCSFTIETEPSSPRSPLTLESSTSNSSLPTIVDCMNTTSSSIEGYGKFIKLMNKTCHKLNLFHTHFMNCHGMKHDGNYTCTKDILKLTLECNKNELFRRITSTIKYECNIRNGTNIKPMLYENTHLLLGSNGYICGKTGWIPNCHGQAVHGNLWSVVNRYNYPLTVIVLGSKNLEKRFEDTEILTNWIYSCLELENNNTTTTTTNTIASKDGISETILDMSGTANTSNASITDMPLNNSSPSTPYSIDENDFTPTPASEQDICT